MLDVNLLRTNLDMVAANVAGKKTIIDKNYFIALENKRKSLQVKMEELQAQRNNFSKQIGNLKSKGENVDKLLHEVNLIAGDLKQAQVDFDNLQLELSNWLYSIPNILDESVPVGTDETNNIEVRKFGTPRNFSFDIKDHVELGFDLNKSIDFETAAKISGARFVILRNKIAKLHRALAQFMLDTHVQEHGYTEMYVPYLVNAKAALGTGNLPKFEDDLFKTVRNNENMYLIPTAEIPLTNIVADCILKENDLPLKFVAHTPCFRSEAGSYGRDTKGMIRMHQFDKVEMVQIVKPEDSFATLEKMTQHAENILKKLNLPYRVIVLCSGDTGFSSAKTYDIEVWLPSQNTYREISSCSNMTNYQTRRIQARYKNANGKNELVHSLNGSGLAVGRTLIAIIENYQNEDGSITIPEVLVPYVGFDKIS
ncbi:MAG: serine--tRNA ligase [Burkholderiales bacterium]|nr:serine--tRNA ligase [Burkholderiales bacterium]